MSEDGFAVALCDRLIDDLNTFAQLAEWDYPIDWGVDCETVVEHIREFREDNTREVLR